MICVDTEQLITDDGDPDDDTDDDGDVYMVVLSIS